MLLCHTEIDGHKRILRNRASYRTGKGTFFIVNECKDCETKVQLLTEDSAFEFMNDQLRVSILEITTRYLESRKKG